MKKNCKVKYGKRTGVVMEIINANLAKIRFDDNNLVNCYRINQLQIVSEINYEKILDDWAEDVLKVANSIEGKLDGLDLLEKKRNEGLVEGLRLALVKFNEIQKLAENNR